VPERGSCNEQTRAKAPTNELAPLLMRRRWVGSLVILAVSLAACTGGTTGSYSEAPDRPPGNGPPVPSGPTGAELTEDLKWIATPVGELLDVAKVRKIGAVGDIRAAWVLADVLRFIQVGPQAVSLIETLGELTQQELDPFSPTAWVDVTNQLLLWDVPPPDDLRSIKAELYLQQERHWAHFFDDVDADVDWRAVTWGGVPPDLRPLDDQNRCACIPALDHPAVTDAGGGEWLADRRVIFGVVVNGEARAYPRPIMEVHEMVNDTLGGREIAIPYCTLCGSAQAFFVDEGESRLVMRTSGLLQRSNKIMFDLQSSSYFDTFAGTAISGPLQGLTLTEISVVSSSWGDWKAEHPNTTIVAQDGGIGRAYGDDPLNGRDLSGPIFPVGYIDPRLGAPEQVLGVFLDNQAYAFPVVETVAVLESGGKPTVGGISVELSGNGLIAFDAEGEQLQTHQAFWFAWSQFNPRTLLWAPDDPAADE